jgi:hypothetical protein
MRAPDVVPILIVLVDDSVVITQFVTCQYRGNEVDWTRDASREEVNREILKMQHTLPAAIKGWRYLDLIEVPTDRTYRNAWQHKDGKIGHDIVKAREIHLTRLRKEREPLLVELDGQWMRATGQKKQKEADEIEAKRQQLRDLPVAEIEAAATVEELKQVKLRT